MNAEAKIYEKGNPWQRKVYRHMAEFLEAKGITTFGKSKNGNYFKHLLAENSEENFIIPEIYEATIERFKQKAGDLNRVLTNTAASQAYCFNLVIYLKQHPYLADKLFSELLGKEVKVDDLVPEFTPELKESLGDQSKNSGTDSDIAVFYTYGENKKGLLLIEFKFIEAEFSVCSSFRTKNNPDCQFHNFYQELIEQRKTDRNNHPLCGYNKKKYLNWKLTQNSEVMDINKIKSLPSCPFRFGLNQLWRNMLLAERVAKVRKCDEFGFWVFSPEENDKYLWKDGETEREFRGVLNERGNKAFRKIYLESILDLLSEIIFDQVDLDWLAGMRKKYKILQ